MEYYGFGLIGAYEGQPHAKPIEHHLELVEMGDSLGLDGWFFAEHHARAAFSLSPSPNLLIAAVARRTKKLRLGSLINILPFQHPVRLAEEIRLLDVLTGGRLEVGYGRGQIRAEQAMYGVVRNDTVAMFDAAYDIVNRLLRGETVAYDTPWWKGRDAIALPEGIQKPVPPSWMAAASDSSIEKAAKLGLNCATSILTRKVVDSHLARYRVLWDQYNPERKGQGKFSIGLTVAIADRREDAYAVVKTDFERKQIHFAHSITDTPGADDETYITHKPNYEKFAAASFEQLMDEGLLVAGTVEDCRQQVGVIRERGIDVMVSHFHNPGSPIEVSKRTLELFATKVIPYVEGRTPKARPAAVH